MKVCIIGIVGLPAEYGGFETLVDNLIDQTENAVNEKKSYTVFCSSKKNIQKTMTYKGAKLIYVPLQANGIQSIAYDVASMFIALLKGEQNFLILGVSGCLFLPFWRLLFPSIRIITNIDGIEWRREKWGKFARFFLKLSEHLAVKHSNSIIADNLAISEYVLHEYGINPSIIAYGGDHVLRNIDYNTADITETFALAICRIEPENNIELILHAYSKSEKVIKFVGNWDASTFGKNLKQKYSKFKNLHIYDPIYDLDKLFMLRKNASVYIHGHSAGGTNPSLVEAMHFKNPIFAYDCLFNRYTLENNGDYFSSIADLKELIENPKKLLQKSDTYNVAAEKYTWKVIRADYHKLFKKVFH
ncbi:DUF1972 domain-containing protein [bacterium]|nr:DUF1972 domain-containing protein [bacterium]